MESQVSVINMKRMRDQVFAHMLQTRSWKYRLFLRQMRLFKYLAFAPVRGTFLESYYVLMRYLDDITDGDLPLPEGENDVVSYLESKISFARAPSNPRDRIDAMMAWCYDLGKRFGQDFTHETLDILESLLFDAKRRGSYRLFSYEELSRHFHKMDIRGTIRATLKVFNDDPDKYLLLEPLGMASRFQFDIEDIKTDLAAGYVNISHEEASELGIELRHLKNPDCDQIQHWLQTHALKGLNHLKAHRKMIETQGAQFSWLQRLTFIFVYERPARKVFERTVKKNEIEVEVQKHEFA